MVDKEEIIKYTVLSIVGRNYSTTKTNPTTKN